MSLVVAVRDDQDLVVACDGRVLSDDLSVMAEDAPKTLALNAELCLGLAGPTNALRHVLASLGLRCRGAHPADLLRVCQEARCPVDIRYEDARSELSGVLRWMLRRVAPCDRGGRIPSILLAGQNAGAPTLAGWKSPTWTPDQSPPAGRWSAVVGQVPPRGSRELEAFREMVNDGATHRPAEECLAHAVRLCARYFGPRGPIGETVFLRRLSQEFLLARAA
jgi:hypothetical protein